MSEVEITYAPEESAPSPPAGWRRTWRFSPWLQFTPAVKAIAIAALAVQIVLSVLHGLEYSEELNCGVLIYDIFGLHWPLLRSGCFWQPLSYAFLHGSWLHLTLNMVTLLFFGSAVEALVGTRRFWQLYLVSAVVAGLGWMLFNWLEPTIWLGLQHLPGSFWGPWVQRWAEQQPIGAYGTCVGASGAVFGLIGAYAALAPRRKLLVLLFFVIPLKLQARTLALLVMAITLVQLVIGWGQIAYSAHLIGCLAGWLLARRWVQSYKQG